MYGTYFCKNAPPVDARSLKKAAKGRRCQQEQTCVARRRAKHGYNYDNLRLNDRRHIFAYFSPGDIHEGLRKSGPVRKEGLDEGLVTSALRKYQWASITFHCRLYPQTYMRTQGMLRIGYTKNRGNFGLVVPIIVTYMVPDNYIKICRFSPPLCPPPCHPSRKPGMHTSLDTVHFSTLTARKHTDLLRINPSRRRSYGRSSRAIRIRSVVSCIPEIPRPGQLSSSRVRSARKVSTLTLAH
jgi:hypothetical protein